MRTEIQEAIIKVIEAKWLQKTVSLGSGRFDCYPRIDALGDRVVFKVEFSFYDYTYYGNSDDYYSSEIPSYTITLHTETLKKKVRGSHNMYLEHL